MKQIEFERWEPDAENPRRLKYAGQRTAEEVFHELEARLDSVGYWYNPAQLMECLKALNGTLMLEVVQHSALLLKTDELVCFQMAVREPKTIESKPQKTKKPRKEAA